MRFRRRADEATTGSVLAGVFAGVLDGRRLWLAVDAQPGVLALRGPGGVLDLPDELSGTPAPPGYLAARLDLSSLPAAAASYDVVLVAPDGATHPVAAPPTAPGRSPAAPGGLVRHVLDDADGVLRLRTEVLAPALELVSVAAGPDRLRLEVEGPGGRFTLNDDDLLAGAGPQLAPVLAGPDRLPVRRRDDDLPDPARGAPLPSAGRLRLRWSGDGLLRARLADGDDA